MFTDEEKSKILAVKQRMIDHVKAMTEQPWFDNGIAIDWSKVYLTGGATASLLQGEEPKDWDFYCEEYATMDAIRDMILRNKNHVKDVDPKYKEFSVKAGKMITSQAITMKDGSSFIIMVALPPDQLKATFDYVHCMPHYHLTSKTLYISRRQYDAAVNKKLVINNAGNVKEWRTHKFKERGYTV